MSNYNLEITTKEYCIKLNKDSFNLAIIKRLIKFLEIENLSLNKDIVSLETDIVSRSHDDFNKDFDRLEDK